MWTPRRILLLVLGLVGLVGAYLVYSLFLGQIDGLPELPRALLPSTSDAPPEPLPPAGPSGTISRLKLAFGPDSPEATNRIAYPLQIELRDKGMAFACGQPAFAPAARPSNIVNVAPFSIAYFGKPDAGKPGEGEEITTAHSDRARLRFDRPVAGVNDIMGTKEKPGAKLIGFVLESDAEELSRDLRQGRIVVTNNQKSARPSDFLVFRTAGPLYYSDPTAGEVAPGNPGGAAVDPNTVAHLTTAAEVEVVDRKNLPRPLRSLDNTTGVLSGEALRAEGAVARIVLGEALPPPTITARGMKIYLTPTPPEPPPAPGAAARAPAPKRGGSIGYSGVRRIELAEAVQFNLWTDGSSPFPGSGPAPKSDKPVPAAVVPDPPPAGLALVGGLLDAGVFASRLESKTLLVIETPGSFRYDFEKGLAEFEAATGPTDHVALTRLSATKPRDDLFCTHLDVTLDGATPPPLPDGKAAPRPQKPQSLDRGGLKIRAVRATGANVFVSAGAEQLLAQGTELLHTVEADGKRTVTTLRGAPVTAKREQNQLVSGGEGVAGEIVITSTEPPATSKLSKRTSTRVAGPGEAGLFDPSTGEQTVRARWNRVLTQERVTIGTEEQDLLKFDGKAEFTDTKADMRLKGDQLWLWLGAGGASGVIGANRGENGRSATPRQLDALGSVGVTSTELVIKDTDQLKLYFRDPKPAPPPARPAGPVAAAPPAPATPAAPPVAPPPEVAKAPEFVGPPAPKPPLVLSARFIQSTLVRQPVVAPGRAPAPPAPARPGSEPQYRYEMDTAICEDRVVAHQDPTDPTKAVRGLDIAGAKLTLDAKRVGGEVAQVMVVTAAPNDIAQVIYESLALYGPTIRIDQSANEAEVTGAGSLLMPSGSDLAGNPSAKRNELDIRWTRSMVFRGSLGNAEFLGTVAAVQQEARPGLLPVIAPEPGAPADDGTTGISRVMGHRLDVTFDRPIYFNQLKRDTMPGPLGGTQVASNTPQPASKSARVKKAAVTPMPDDEASRQKGAVARTVRFTEEQYDRNRRLLKAQSLEGREIEVQVADARQDVAAAGPGELRILQPDGGDALAVPAPGAPAPAANPAAPYKLTLVRFDQSMRAVDKGKLYQQADFAGTSKVWNLPTNNVNFPLVDYEVPAGTTHLSSDRSMVVSSSRARPDAPPDQQMVAQGNGQFYDDKYAGTAATIRYQQQSVIFDGSGDRLALVAERKRSPGVEVGNRAKQYVYNRKTGEVQGNGVSSGVLPGSSR